MENDPEPTHVLRLSLKVRKTELAPEELTRLIGVPPDHSGKKGTMAPSGIARRANYWVLRSGAPEMLAEVEDHWAALEPRCVPLADRLKSLSGKAEVVLLCWIEMSDYIPPLIFPSSMLVFAANAGAIIEVDGVVGGEDEDLPVIVEQA